MKVLVVGAGGREHALAWRLAAGAGMDRRADRVIDRVIVSPGNPGVARDIGLECLPLLSVGEIVDGGYDLVVIGPEEPLVHGFADSLRAGGVSVVGPSAEAARLEGSKAFAKGFMVEHGVPTADYRICTTISEAYEALDFFGDSVVVKADGLTSGKGVAVCRSRRQAEAAVESMMRDRLYGDAGTTIVVEEYLEGHEASIVVLVDESGYVIMPTSQDHNALEDGNGGANTGGMGVVVPNPEIDSQLLDRIEEAIVVPSVQGIRERDWVFRGALFIGLMVGEGGPWALEYNVRFGDPETQAIMPMIQGDFYQLLKGLADGRLMDAVKESGFGIRSGAACTVVAASAGYPGPFSRGLPIRIDDTGMGGTRMGGTGDAKVFFGGVKRGSSEEEPPGRAPSLVTGGGRVLAVSAWGEDLDQARFRAYEALLMVHFDGMQYRRDIGGPNVMDRILEEGSVTAPQFEKRGGLLPVVVQEASSDTVLMVAYTNRDAYDATRKTGYAHFWSTSRNTLWKKGETSGDVLVVEEIRLDCDQDAFLYRVRLLGEGVCHTTDSHGVHRKRCFYRTIGPEGRLQLSE